MVVYINEQGAVINISGERIILKKAGQIIAVFLTKDLDQVVLMGNIGLTTQSIRHFLQNKIDVVFTSASGKYEGRLVQELGKNVALRRLQFEATQDEKFKFKIAKSIIYGKYKNSISALRKLNYYHKSKEVSDILNQLTARHNDLIAAEIYESLLGYEGIISSIYFSAFDYLLNKEIKFEKRTRRPPQNEFNALLSFGYTILSNLIRTEVYITGLDPYFGVLHAEDYGRPSLVLDLMEEFRAIAVDMPAINAVNKGLITKSDFVLNDDGNEDHLPIQLTIFGRKKWLSILEKRFNSFIWYQPKNQKTTLRNIIKYQCYLISKSFIEKAIYQPFILI